MTPADILTGAADLIAEHGKCSDGRYRNDDGGLCAVGAMRQFAFGDAYATPTDGGVDRAVGAAYTTARVALRQHIGRESVTTWSDTSTADEVVAELRRTADGLRAGTAVAA